MMEIYKNLSGNSGVATFQISARSIAVEFKTGGTYLYDYNAPGRVEVEEMKRLARLGRGLATYINQQVRNRYERRLDYYRSRGGSTGG